MNPNLLLLAVSFSVCLVLTPAVRSLAIQNGWYDMPGDLKIHSTPIPRLAGVALMAAILVSTLFAPPSSRAEAAILFVLVGVWALGLVDDLKGTPAVLRLVVDIACGAAVWLLGWKLQWFANPYLDLAATALFLAFAINSMNLLDGMDGLALTVSGVAGIGFIVLFFGAQTGFASGLAWSLVAACAALLYFNWPPARIFIGDSGSTLLGAVLAILVLEWVRVAPNSNSTLLPLTFLALPLADTIAAVIRRLRRKQSPFVGDRRHFYDLLLRRGWTVRQILLFSGFTTLLLLIPSLVVVRAKIDYRISVFLCFALYGFFAFRLGSFDSESPAAVPTVPQPCFEPTLSQE